MSEIIEELYAGKPEVKLYNKTKGKKKIVNSILLGTWLGVTEKLDNGWLHVKTIGPDGWLRVEDTRKEMGLKLFFIDVGQGDSCLIETQGARILVDCGPNKNTYNYLVKWKYKWLLEKTAKLDIDAIFISHFDFDHFAGAIPLIKDSRVKINTIYHPGIARFHDDKAIRLAKYDTTLGRSDTHGQTNSPRSVLRTSFNDIDDAKRLLNEGGLKATFRKFLEEVVKAHNQDRLKKLKRLTGRNTPELAFGTNRDLKIRILAPIPVNPSGKITYPWFTDASHTINGHSLVLRLLYRDRTILLGGDLNTDAENYLLNAYQPSNPFLVDVAKACHHGASEFTVDFLKAVKPYATIISSGDNENYSHPRADAVGSAGRYSRGARPKVFSTELARSINSGRDIHYGLINLRSDGKIIAIAQMLESRRSADLWDSYEVP